MSSRNKSDHQRPISTERRRPDSSRPGTPRPRSSTPVSSVRQSQPWPGDLGENRGNDKFFTSSDHTLKPVANGVVQQRPFSGTGSSPGGRNGRISTGKITPQRKTPTPTPERKRTPVRRTASEQTENARPSDNNSPATFSRWPSSNSPRPLSMCKSVDWSSEKPAMVLNRPTKPNFAGGPSPSAKSSPQIPSRYAKGNPTVAKFPNFRYPGTNAGVISDAMSDTVSDTESLGSDGTAGSGGSGMKVRITPKRTPTPTLNSRRSSSGGGADKKIRASVDLSSPAFSSGGKSTTPRVRASISVGSPRASPWSLPGRLSSPSSPSLSCRGLASPTSSSKASPFQQSYAKTPTFTTSFGPTSPFTPSFGNKTSPFQQSYSGSLSNLNLDSGKGRKFFAQQEEALQLRILQNRYLQWRFVNARSDDIRASQNAAAERSLYNARVRISELHKSVAENGIKLQRKKHKLKKKRILSSQGPHLETWSTIQQEHTTALCGAMDALEAAVLRVPVTAGAKADVGAIRDGLRLAVDVMDSVESVVANLMPKTEEMQDMVTELANVAKQEKAVVEECSLLLERVAALEIEERSLRMHSVQRECDSHRI